MFKMDYRPKIYTLHLSRKILAQRLGLTYTSFSSRLCSFTPWGNNEEYQLRKILDEAEQAQAQAGEKNSEKNLSFFQR
jgi:hypothetical protein